MKCGIIGLPNVGKSTLFNCISKNKAKSSNFPFCTIKSNIGSIQVPDKRLEKLAELINPQRIIPVTVDIIDIAGIIKGSYKGEGLGNKFLANISETNAIIHVLRCFENTNILHVESYVDPIRDKEILDIELRLKDLETINKIIEKINKKVVKNLHLLKKISTILNSGHNIRTFSFSKEEKKQIKCFKLLTDKPVLYICNVGENYFLKGNAYTKKIKLIVEKEKSELLIFSLKIEYYIAEFFTSEERKTYFEYLGIKEPSVNKLIRKSYELLKFNTFFTLGRNEIRAWKIPKGWTVFQAASVIHTDFKKGFICAEVIHYDDFINFKSKEKTSEAGKLFIEGRKYIVKDGDIIHIRFKI